MEPTNVDLEDVYKFGRAKGELRIRLTYNLAIDTSYQKYKIFAHRLNIDLPDEPSEETDIDAKKFIWDQIKKAEHVLYDLQNEVKHVGYVYFAGEQVSRFIQFLQLSKLDQSENNMQWRNGLQDATQKLHEMAANLKVDVTEELDTMKNCENFDGITIHAQEIKIKEKLCKNKDPKHSEVDETRVITDEDWVVSLLRLPERKNDEHAFLVLEGKSGNSSMIWFADFVANDKYDLMRDGKVRIDPYQSQGEVGSSDKLLFNCRKKMMDIRPGDRFLSSTWPIPKPTAEILIKNIEAKKKNPPKFNILGDSSALAGSTAATKSTQNGHNCYTFARRMLRDLKNQYIQLPQETLIEWITYSATSRVLVDEQAQRWKASRFTLILALLLGAVAGVVIAYVLQKLL